MLQIRIVIAISAFGLVSSFGSVTAQDTKGPSPKKEPVPSLRVGDSAPALQVTRWLQGEAVPKFEPGKAYVVHFWAPWCSNCVSFMPRLAELQAQYKDEGLKVIGVSIADPNNSEENVAAFVKKRGPILKYTIAFAGDRATYDTWVTAAGVKTMSCTFVVDKTGRIANIGHVMYLPVAIPKAVSGTATAKEIGSEMDKVRAEVEAWMGVVQRDPKAGLQAIKEFETKYPPLADHFLAAVFKLGLLPKYGKPGEAKAYSEALVAKAVRNDDVRMLSQTSRILRTEGQKNEELLALAVRAAEAAVRIEGGKDAQCLIELANAYSAVGDKAKAKEYARKASVAASGEPSALKESIEKEARRLGAEK